MRESVVDIKRDAFAGEYACVRCADARQAHELA
jgi:hypothetical protein